MNFRQKVYEIVKTIPVGKVITYKQIGNKLDPRSYQAIGQELKNNPNPMDIPCHRMIISNKKIELLLNEGIKIENEIVYKNCVIL